MVICNYGSPHRPPKAPIGHLQSLPAMWLHERRYLRIQDVVRVQRQGRAPISGSALGHGQPGHYILLCGPCKYRDGSYCTHSALRANGGEGLEITFSNPIGNVIVCSKGRVTLPNPAQKCSGFEDKYGNRSKETAKTG